MITIVVVNYESELSVMLVTNGHRIVQGTDPFNCNIKYGTWNKFR
jgi:hypothetical protein